MIQDVRTTPFNVGIRIDLTDFTYDEASPLAEGLGGGPRGRQLLARVLQWTGGHPYLTQRLCRSIAEEGIEDAMGVDRLCRALFFAAGARERDDNLLFVRDRLLRSGEDVAGLLTLYRGIWAGRRVHDDARDPLAGILKISGIVRTQAGHLKVRNRIYFRAFDREWIRENLPGAELRRQREAYRRGVLRTTAVAAVVFAVMGMLAWRAIRSEGRARQENRKAARAAMEARQQAQRADGNAARAASSAAMIAANASR